MKKNLLSRLGKTLSLVEGYRCCRKSSCRHPEFISGSQESKQMLKQVQHDGYSTGKMLNPVQHDGRNDCYPASHHCYPEFPLRHPEFISGSQESKEMLNPVQHDDNRIGQLSNQALHNRWRRTSFSLGRSMIEMLGVLAIIGVLSIGGLYAYRQAMARYRANQIMDVISRIRFAFQEKCPSVEKCDLKYWPTPQSYCNYGDDICFNDSTAFLHPFTFLPSVVWYAGRSTTGGGRVLLFYMRGLSEEVCNELTRKNWNPLFRNYRINNEYLQTNEAAQAKCHLSSTDFVIYWYID